MAADPNTPMPRRLVVDGVEFEARADADQPGAVRFTRLTPPAVGYGFTSQVSTHDPAWWTVERLEESIRGFLAGCDPVTGYMEDDD